jgi:hypothetical protein
MSGSKRTDRKPHEGANARLRRLGLPETATPPAGPQTAQERANARLRRLGITPTDDHNPSG